MKKCPFCAEEIQDEAIKCKHCMEFLDNRARPQPAESGLCWYYRTGFIILAVCSVGPFALPLIWFRPKTSRLWKIGITVAVLVLSWLLTLVFLYSIRILKDYYNAMMNFKM